MVEGFLGHLCCFSLLGPQTAISSTISDFNQQTDEPIFTWGFRNRHRRRIVGGHLEAGSFSLATESQTSIPQEVGDVLWRILSTWWFPSLCQVNAEGVRVMSGLGWGCLPWMTHPSSAVADTNHGWLQFLLSLSKVAFNKCFYILCSNAPTQSSCAVDASSIVPILEMRELGLQENLWPAQSPEARLDVSLLISEPTRIFLVSFRCFCSWRMGQVSMKCKCSRIVLLPKSLERTSNSLRAGPHWHSWFLILVTSISEGLLSNRRHMMTCVSVTETLKVIQAL